MTKEKQAETEGVTGRAADEGVEAALGQVLRDAHRAMARSLQSRIALHGVSMGQWFFLRALWDQDGLTQRELSQRVGMMEPTTVTAINSMERRGLVTRVRNPHDRRKVNIYLTPKGRELRDILLPCAAEVARAAVAGVPEGQVGQLMDMLRRIIGNLDSATDPAVGLVTPEVLED